MAMIPQNQHTTENQIENKEIILKPTRGYLGMSGLGSECIAKIWYGFRFASESKITPRVKRIFERGDLEEARIIRDLRGIGAEVFRREGENKIEMTGNPEEEQEEIVGFAGHAKGHPDGRCLGLPEAPKTEHLLEMKTMKDSSYNDLYELRQQHGEQALQRHSAAYWGQVHRYMGAMDLKRALYVVTNKDNEARQYFRIKFDKEYYEELLQKERIVITQELPFRASFKSDFYQCGWCNHYNVCHFKKAPQRNCRTCKKVNILDDGKWECGIGEHELTLENQLKACAMYERLF